MILQEIWKFPLEYEDPQEVMMPKGAIILTAQMEPVMFGKRAVIWAIVDLSEKVLVSQCIRVLDTGEPCKGISGMKHIATVQHGDIVNHIFEETK